MAAEQKKLEVTKQGVRDLNKKYPAKRHKPREVPPTMKFKTGCINPDCPLCPRCY